MSGRPHRESDGGMGESAFLTTNAPQLDLILGGGIAARSLMLISGQSGAGKTVLASQIAFSAARNGDRVLFVTAFSEPHSKLISNLQQFSFFDQNLIGERIKLLNIQPQLAASVAEAGETIVREARAHAAGLVVLDGFQGISITSRDPFAGHQFLYDLNAKLSLLDITAIITYSPAGNDDANQPELSAVDGILMLTQELIGEHTVRLLQIVKQRGSVPLLGQHSFEITNDGLLCYPQHESISVDDDVSVGNERRAFGIPALDALLNGGLNTGTNTVVAGATGVGKTLLGLHYLMQGVERGEAGLLIGFGETPRQLIAKGQQFGFDLQAAIDRGLLSVQHYSPIKLNVDHVAQRLRAIAETGTLRRVVIDGLNDLELPLRNTSRAHDFFAALITFVRSQQITSCMTLEIDSLIGHELSLVGRTFSGLADNLVLLRRDERDGRNANFLAVIKTRFSSHDQQFHRYTITPIGIRIEPDPPSRARHAR